MDEWIISLGGYNMSFRDEAKKIEKKKVELLENRVNVINEKEYELLYDNLFSYLKGSIKEDIIHKRISYDEGFFNKKNPRYEAYYGICITVYPEKEQNFYNGVYIYDKTYSSIYDGGWFGLETAYLSDVRKSLGYLLEKAKSDQFDHILIDTHNCERYLRNGQTGTEFTLDNIDSIIMKFKQDWKKNVEANYSLYSCVNYLCDIIVQIKCDWEGNIT